MSKGGLAAEKVGGSSKPRLCVLCFEIEEPQVRKATEVQMLTPRCPGKIRTAMQVLPAHVRYSDHHSLSDPIGTPEIRHQCVRHKQR